MLAHAKRGQTWRTKHSWEERRAKSRLLGTRIACRVARCDAGSPPGDPEGSPQGDPHSRASNVTSRVAREKTECVSSTLELDFFNLSGLPWQLGFDQVRRDIVKHGVSHAGQPPTEMHERGFFASRADTRKEQGGYPQQTYPIASGVLWKLIPPRLCPDLSPTGRGGAASQAAFAQISLHRALRMKKSQLSHGKIKPACAQISPRLRRRRARSKQRTPTKPHFLTSRASDEKN